MDDPPSLTQRCVWPDDDMPPHMNDTQNDIAIRPRLADILPGFASEMRRLLAEAGESSLASQVDGLVVHGRCACDDESCAAVEMTELPQYPGRQDYDDVLPVERADGRLWGCVAVVDGRIARVDTFGQPELRDAIHRLFPRTGERQRDGVRREA